MPSKPKPTTALAPVPKELTKVKAKLTHLVIPISTKALALKVRDDDDYTEADAALKLIRESRKSVAGDFDPIIAPARQSLEAVYALRRSFDKPLDDAEKHVREIMRVYSLAEEKRIADEKWEQEAASRKLMQEAKEAQRLADQAKRPQEAAKLEKKAERLIEQAQDVAAVPVQGPVKATSSTTRRVKKIRVDDLKKFLAHVVAGKVSEESVDLNMIYIMSVLTHHPEQVASWPGLSVYEDIQIIGR